MSALRLVAVGAHVRHPRRFFQLFLSHLALARSRRNLRHLDDHLLRDIGLTRAQAEAELGRPIWDAPLHWRQ